MSYREVTPQQALELLTCERESEQVVMLDVRTYPEWVGGHVPSAVHIPLDELAGRYQELDPDAVTLVICAHGVRSAAAGQWLAQVGFDNVANVRHGICRWPGPIEYGPGEIAQSA